MRRKICFLSIIAALFSLTVNGQGRTIDSLKRIIALGKRDSVEAQVYVLMANALSRTDLITAKNYALAGLHLSQQLRLPQQTAAGYTNMVTFSTQTKHPDSAEFYLASLKKFADGSKIIAVKSTFNQAAGLYYRAQGNYRESLVYLKESLRLAVLSGNKLSIAGCNLNIGNSYTDLGDFRNAMTNHLSALKLFEELGNKRGISFCYAAIAEDFIKLKQYGEAKTYLKKSLDLKTELNDKRGQATCYINLAEIQREQNRPDSALANYLKALVINHSLKLGIEEGKTDLDIGELYASQKDRANALDYLNRGKVLFAQSADSSRMATVDGEIASLQKDMQTQKSTENTFLSTIKTSIKTGDKTTEINNYKHLAEFYTANKQFDKALQYNEKYHAALDSEQSKDLKVQVKRLEEGYNAEKKDQEISLLKKDQLIDRANLRNQELFRYGLIVVFILLVAIALLIMARYRAIQKARRLIEIEKIRNNIARNLHDDIGSTISSINILSNVALKQAQGNDKVLKDLEKIKDSSFSIMESMSDIVWAINPANDPLDKTILKMKEFAVAILEPAGIEVAFDEDDKLKDLKLGVDERKNLYLIFKEAINNIAKYSDATSANVMLGKTANEFVMHISDNGKGFNDKGNYNGNGLKNMQSRSDEMKAVLSIASQPSAGTRISLAIAIT